MPASYELIESRTLASSAATVEFTSISSVYIDIVVIINSTLTSSTGAVQAILNSDTGSNYSWTRLSGDGSSASSDRVSNTATGMFIGDTGTTPTTIIAHFQNYKNTATNKTAIARSSDSSVRGTLTVNLWRSTSAISTIKFQNNAATNFAIGSMFTLYGIRSA